MRISVKKIVLFSVLLCILFFIWNFISEESGPTLTQTCNQLESVQQDLHLMTHSVHEILQVLNVTNFLCYGTLWGQIRLSRILPWEDKTVVCLLNEDISSKDELLIARMFRKKGFIITYDSTEGQYYVYKQHGNLNEKNLKILLPVFELNKLVKMYRRVGWKRRLLPPDCERLTSLDCFPPRLIRSPLPKKEFGGKLLPVPREGIEIQKYHYRDNWWKEVTIKNC